MTEKMLYIEIFQPFAQYRNPFTFYYAQTYPLPPKSTIIGMLQYATDRYYDSEFWNLSVSIHGGFESVFWNYQQLIKGDIEISNLRIMNQNKPLYNEGIKSRRSPVHQQELFNGHVYLFIKGKEDIINEIHSSIEKPKKVISLGRSEDVAFIRKVSENFEVKEGTARKSIWLRYPTYIKREVPIRNQKYPVYSIPVFVEFRNSEVPVRNKAEITKGTERVVKFQTVIYTGFDYVLKLSKPIRYEEFVCHDKEFRIISDFGWL